MTASAITAYLGRWEGSPVYVDMVEPDLTHVPWGVLCRGAAGINRFNGVTRPLISVAGHSMRLMRRLPMGLKVYGLLHGLHQAIMGDQTRPFRDAIALHGDIGTLPIDTLESTLRAAVMAKAKLPWRLPPLEEAILTEADDWACEFEVKHDKAGTLAKHAALETLTPHASEFTRVVESAIALHHMRAQQTADRKLEGAH